MKDKKKAFTMLKADSLREIIGGRTNFFFGGAGKVTYISRGGVEDTRLEAKAKDTKKSEAKAKDSPSEDRPSRGQGQECSRPRSRIKNTGASGLKKKKRAEKKVFKNFFQAISEEKIFKKILQAIYKILTIQKIVLSSSQGQGNFRRLEASRRRTSSRTPPL